MGADAKTIHNERTKLLANALDRASTACLTVGVATPIAGYFYGVGNVGALHPALLGLLFEFWIIAAVVLHVLARRALGGLQ